MIATTASWTSVAAARFSGAGSRRGRWLALFPAVATGLFLGPVAVGLAGTILPSFGLLPVLGGTELSLRPWSALLAAPGLTAALRLTLTTGIAATALALIITLAFCATWHGTRLFRYLQRLLAPLLAVPHAGFAIGLAFLIAPSGWLARLLSPWATGWERPPDLAMPHDAYGIAVVAGLVCKEVPFLLLVVMGALDQASADRALAVARTLGRGPLRAWLEVVLPSVYRQIRLPVLAVLAYSLSAAEVALILGPTTPPPLTPLLLRWFADPDLALRFQASAGAALQLGLVILAVGAWYAAERLVAVLGGGWGTGAGRGLVMRLISLAAITTTTAAGIGSILVLALWSVAERWRFPDALPASVSLRNIARAADGIGPALTTTIATAAAATALALILVVGCLEHERQRHLGARAIRRALFLVYVPLLLPQIGFLFGAQTVLIVTGLDATFMALVWAHLLFVLPYVFLTLADPYRALSPAHGQVARTLGRSPGAVLLRVRLPLLRRPLLIAAAVGFAVSVGQYLPTLFAGAGRYVTLTTEAVVLAGGADRGLTAIYALAQTALPLLAFIAALAVPALLDRRRHRR